MASICAPTPLRPACDVDRWNRSISSASASWSQSHYRWNPYDKTCPRAPITPTNDSTASATASPIHFHLEFAVPSIAFPLPVDAFPLPVDAFPLPVDLSPRTESSEAPLHATRVFHFQTDSSFHDSDDTQTDDSAEAAPAKVIEYRSYGIKVTKSTAAYREYMRRVPLSSRTATDPTTPRPAVRCSRKQWGMQMKLWRQALENYRF